MLLVIYPSKLFGDKSLVLNLLLIRKMINLQLLKKPSATKYPTRVFANVPLSINILSMEARWRNAAWHFVCWNIFSIPQVQNFLISCFKGGQFYVIPSFDDMPVGAAQCILEHCNIGVHGTTGFHLRFSFLIACCFLLDMLKFNLYVKLSFCPYK